MHLNLWNNSGPVLVQPCFVESHETHVIVVFNSILYIAIAMAMSGDKRRFMIWLIDDKSLFKSRNIVIWLLWTTPKRLFQAHLFPDQFWIPNHYKLTIRVLNFEYMYCTVIAVRCLCHLCINVGKCCVNSREAQL